MPIEISGVTDAELDTALANIAVLPKREQIELLAELNELEKSQTIEKRQTTFLELIMSCGVTFNPCSCVFIIKPFQFK